MRQVVKKIIANSKGWLRTVGDRGIERHFQKINYSRFGANRSLSNFTLIRKYRCLIDELEYERDPYMQRIIADDLASVESELRRRCLLRDAGIFD
ncbi:MAG: hypothetical protein HY779_01125 [Rubrobacteridae bacterium]|nr:hypothetical protein [Rubrobacteridae bacterium]